MKDLRDLRKIIRKNDSAGRIEHIVLDTTVLFTGSASLSTYICF